MSHRKVLFWIGLSLAYLLPVLSAAQTIYLYSPTNETTVKEGDDYATTQLGNPWDMNERRDIGWEENFYGTSIKATNGVWQATHKAGGGYVLPLFGGFNGSLFAEGLPGDKTLPGLGPNHPIDTTKYRVLSYRTRHSSPSSYVVIWASDISTSNWPSGNNMIASYDGFNHHSKVYRYSSDWNVRSLDLSKASANWSSKKAYALRFDPSISTPDGATFAIDWIRLVDPDSAPTHTIKWQSYFLEPYSLITVYVDTDNTGYDGTPLEHISVSSADPGSYTFSTAILPPGQYYFYLTVMSDGLQKVVAQSGYSGKLTVTARPTGYFTAPSTVSGEEYATSVKGNPWDMNDASDLSNLDPAVHPALRQFTNPKFSNGLFSALADPPLTGNTETDAQVHLKLADGQPIDTNKFRYVTYRVKLDETLYPTITDKVRDGFVTRSVFWNDDIATDGVRPPAHITYEGWHTYTYDMRGSNAGFGLLEAGVPYSQATSLRNFRVDPMETHDPTMFYLDYVKLNAENTPTDYKYNIKWNISDKDSSSFTLSLYYDNNKSGFNGTKITTLTVPSGAGSYTWNTASLKSGKYYIYMVLSDGQNTYKTYSQVHISTAKAPARSEFDYDGDGKSDQVVFRPTSTGSFYINGSSQGQYAVTWGKKGDMPFEADIDGDRKVDQIVRRTDSLNRYNWYIRRSSDGALTYQIWGQKGDVCVLADYNADSKDEIAIFRKGLWLTLYADGTTVTKSLGQYGDVPVPADYDGDGKTDRAIFRPSNGNWYILKSSTGSTITRKWGASGHKPIPADYTGDKKADLAVFIPGRGEWRIKDITNENNTYGAKYGTKTDAPKAGDFNGDRIADLSIVRPSTAVWYHNFRNGLKQQLQWGVSSDIVPRQ